MVWQYLRSKLLLPLPLALAAALAPGCGEKPKAEAYKIESLDQGVGGPVANARIGDFALKNDRIIAVVEGGRSSFLPLDVGGSLIDLDLLRPESEYHGGRGLDQLGQIAPVANLGLARAIEEGDVRITRASGGAQVTSSGLLRGTFKIIDGLTLVLKRPFMDPNAPDKEVRVYNEYEVRPGERLVRITTTLGFGVPFCSAAGVSGCSETCDDALYDKDCHCDAVPAGCTEGTRLIDADTLPDGPNRGLVDTFLGQLPRPLGSGKCVSDADCDKAKGETCVRFTEDLGGDARVCRASTAKDAGYFMGDMLLFGGHLSTFIPGTGYDTDTDIRRLFDKGGDTLATPLELPAIYATGDRVSYGYSPVKGNIMVPIFGGPFSFGATGSVSCRHDQPGCLTRTLVRYERWVSVGEGDISSAQEPLSMARGEALGSVEGTVLYAHSDRPISGAQVFALRDPRTLACEGECRTRCAPIETASDDEVKGWTVDRVMAENKCRSHATTYLEGNAGLVSAARTDPGTDKIRDGRYTLRLTPGRYVLIAQTGPSRSNPAPVEVKPDQTTTASLYLVEPGRLEYTIYDDRGGLTAGRVLVGTCFPESPCQTDADCDAGNGRYCHTGMCSCVSERLRPLELGGSRFVDGTLLTDQTGTGHGTLELPPGTYDVIFARGPHSSIDKKRVTIFENTSSVVAAKIQRTVDRSGWVAADFHVHGAQSIDSGLALMDRVNSYLAEDMDFMSSSDHDNLTNYAPIIEAAGLRKRLGSQIGVETTTQELGHFIAYPMRYEERTPEGERLPGNNAPDWRGLPPQEIFDSMRSRAVTTGSPFVVEVPHPYSYFDYYRIDPKTMESNNSILAILNPLVSSARFSGDFDAMELINSQGLDLIRRPTIAEIGYYSGELDKLLKRSRSNEIDEPTYQRLYRSLTTETTRRILHRTKREQVAALAGQGAEIACLCASDGDCAAGLACNPTTMTCGTPPLAPGAESAKGEGLCRSSRGVIDDWFNMLNRGVKRAGVGGSDVHGLYGGEAATPRTMLRTGASTNPQLRDGDITAAILGFHSVVTNGPFVRFHVDEADIGDTMSKPNGQDVALRIRVEKAPYYDVDRVEVYRNGELIHWINGCGGTRRTGDDPEPHQHPCVRTGNEALAYEETIFDRPARDSWYVVIALGLDGRPLTPVYSSVGQSRFGTFEIAQRLYDLIPVLTALRTPRFPSVFPIFPVAITNPIWVDVDGDGWLPSQPQVTWCTSSRDINCPN